MCFIHHACTLPQNMLPRLWKDKEFSLHVSVVSMSTYVAGFGLETEISPNYI